VPDRSRTPPPAGTGGAHQSPPPSGAARSGFARGVPPGAVRRGRLVFGGGTSGLRVAGGAPGTDLYRVRPASPGPRVRTRGDVAVIRFPSSSLAQGWPALPEGPALNALGAGVRWQIAFRGGASHVAADLRGLALAGPESPPRLRLPGDAAATRHSGQSVLQRPGGGTACVPRRRGRDRERSTAMIDDAALRRVEQAEARLERARRRLGAAQAVAYFGAGAPGALEAAILAHRRAEAEAAAARAALGQRSGGDRGPGPGVAPARPSEEPSPRLRFVRWLVQTGRLSDWGGPSDGRAA
jgi:hypothetical protein